MTPYQIVTTRRAATDLTRIYRHIERSSPVRAANVLTDIFVAIETLKLTPHRNVVASQPAGRLDPVRSMPADP